MYYSTGKSNHHGWNYNCVSGKKTQFFEAWLIVKWKERHSRSKNSLSNLAISPLPAAGLTPELHPLELETCWGQNLCILWISRVLPEGRVTQCSINMGFPNPRDARVRTAGAASVCSSGGDWSVSFPVTHRRHEEDIFAEEPSKG